MSDSNFYLGRPAGTSDGQTTAYNPDDLTTHAVIVGMTGSGKTGLLISLLEEAAQQGLPAIIIDPKGDLTNLLLHFPDLAPTDFEPWIDPEAARRQRLSIPQLAETTASRWQTGLKEWGLGRTQLSALCDQVDYTVFTPGSSAGQPVNLLASFASPGLPWQEYREVLRERISSSVTALLGLIGFKDVDPLRSREHILLSNILEIAWSKDQSLDLTELILQTQNPPFERLGAFPVNSFFPEKDRFELALLLNNFLASPSFQSWAEGQSLDMQQMLFTPQGKARFSIFYLAHLSETERMFFVTLLLAAVESWMRAQRGSPGLRAVLAFDEIVGYLPPVANPPSRPVLLRLLKQARAFGLGLLLATQNPVDIDYKGLSNAGTWFIGRLQTENDKERLLDGLQSLEGGVDRAAFDRLIAGLKPRLFLLHNVHTSGGPQIFQTRWTLNYLAGPLTRLQLGGLKQLASLAAPLSAKTTPVQANIPVTARPAAVSASRTANFPSAALPAKGSRTAPAAPAGVRTFTLPAKLAISQALTRLGGSYAGPVQPQGILYQPALLVQANVRFYSLKYSLDHTQRFTCLLDDDPGQHVDWDAAVHEPFDPEEIDTQPLPDARFAPLPGFLTDTRALAAYQKNFADWVYHTANLRLYANTALKLYSDPGDSQAVFRQKVDRAVRQALKAEQDKTSKSLNAKLETLERKIENQEMQIRKDQDEVSQRGMEELASNASLVFGIFGRRKRSLSAAVSKHRLTSRSKADLDASRKLLNDLNDQYAQLVKERDLALDQLQERWAITASETSEITVATLRKDIAIEASGIAWTPHYILQAEGQTFQARAL